jgi:hypothetical protein
VQERLLRELTQEYADLLKEVAARTMDDAPAVSPGAQVGTYSGS